MRSSRKRRKVDAARVKRCSFDILSGDAEEGEEWGRLVVLRVVMMRMAREGQREPYGSRTVKSGGSCSVLRKGMEDILVFWLFAVDRSHRKAIMIGPFWCWHIRSIPRGSPGLYRSH